MTFGGENMSKQQIINALDRLKKRLKKEFEDKKLIGDIFINDDEYNLLLFYAKQKINQMINANYHQTTDKMLTIALVQIGIRKYDGKLWPHIDKELEMKLNTNHQQWINKSVLLTLKKYNKIHVNRNDIMNLLMHGFVSDYYADKFFTFLFEYYRIDLERSLNRNSPTLFNALFDVMIRNDNTGRTYYLVQQTAEVITENIKGSKIRIRNYLRLMDGLFWQTMQAKRTSNRLINKLITWTEKSKEFNLEKKAYFVYDRHSKKNRLVKPYLKHDFNKSKFFLIIPPHPFLQAEINDLNAIKWIIDINGTVIDIHANLEQTVTGYKTMPVEYPLSFSQVFDSIRIELLFDGKGEKIHKFAQEQVRFFNSQGYLTEAKLLKSGEIYAFSPNDYKIKSEAILEVKSIYSINRYYFNFNQGDLLIFPNGKYISIDQRLEEGISNHYLLQGAHALHKDRNLNIFTKAPSYLFQIESSQIEGSVIIVNDRRLHLNLSNALALIENTSDEYHWYMISLEDYGVFLNGIYHVIIDIVNSHKRRELEFLLIQKFDYRFENSPYVYQYKGTITFPKNINIMPVKKMATQMLKDTTSYDFEITENLKTIEFNFPSSSQTTIQIEIPIFRWSYDCKVWHNIPLKDVFYTQMPFILYLNYPSDNAKISVDILDIDEEINDQNYELTFVKNKQSDCFIIDLTRYRSLISKIQGYISIKVEFESNIYPLLNVITRSHVNNFRFKYDDNTYHLVGNYDIIGEAEYELNLIDPDGKSINKTKLYNGDFDIMVNAVEGYYTLELSEIMEDDSGFSIEYNVIDTRKIVITDPYNLKDKVVIIKSIINQLTKRVFTLKQSYVISDILKKEHSEPGTYKGLLTTHGYSEFGQKANYTTDVEIVFFDLVDMGKASIQFKDDDVFLDFLYDNKYKILIKDEDPNIRQPLKYSRFEEIICHEGEYQYLVNIQEKE